MFVPESANLSPRCGSDSKVRQKSSSNSASDCEGCEARCHPEHAYTVARFNFFQERYLLPSPDPVPRIYRNYLCSLVYEICTNVCGSSSDRSVSLLREPIIN